jgi:hypothetical protein
VSASARTIVWGVNRVSIDLGLLKSVPIYSGGGSLRLTSYLDELQARSGWLVLYTPRRLNATFTLWMYT